MFIVQIREGQSISVGDRVLTALSVPRPGLVEMTIDGETDPVTISWDRRLEILPAVYLTVDRTACYTNKIKLFFDAPRTIKIREQPYEPPRPDHGI